MDYAMPRADQVADIAVDFNEVLDPNNDLGVKGIGEGGACAAPSAVVNAVLDALASRGIDNIDMPMTPMRVWQALQQAQS
jgi:carbon-monoxide dehydrogenase large subunit